MRVVTRVTKLILHASLKQSYLVLIAHLAVSFTELRAQSKRFDFSEFRCGDINTRAPQTYMFQLLHRSLWLSDMRSGDHAGQICSTSAFSQTKYHAIVSFNNSAD